MNILDARIFWALSASLTLAACGGNVVLPPGSGGSGGNGGDTTASSSTGGTLSCANGCPQGTVCLLGSNTCAPSCDPSGFTPCGAGTVCDMCASSSCPLCDDCVAACLPAQPGKCDDHDDCPKGQVCLYGLGECAPACSDVPPQCQVPDQVCNDCATSSCPGCEDCVGACTGSF